MTATFRELADELEFEDDWEGFLTWSGLEADEGQQAPWETCCRLRHAYVEAPKVVERGIKLLDAADHPEASKESGWRAKIDLGTLEVDDTDRCILGQVYGSFDQGLSALRIKLFDAWRYGFTANDDVEYPQLQAEWIRQLD